MTKRLIILAGVLVAAMLPLQPAAAALPSGLFHSSTPSLAPMLKKVLPAVVNIKVTGKAQQLAQNPLLNDPFFRHFFGGPGQQPQQQREVHPQAIGSGVIVNADKGLVITNNHVIKDAEKIVVKLKDGREVKAKLVGTDPDSDIAVLKIKADHLTALKMADSDKLKVGDFVVAIGDPFGLGQTVTSGIVSGLGRHGLGTRYEDFIQTDASINPGNSGGALVNLNGELVGINSAILSRSGGNIGIGFAIPANLARSTMQQLVKYGEVKRGRLGVVGQNLTDQLAKAFDLKRHNGVVIAQVVPKSPAEKAGIQERDVITAVDGKPIDNFSELANAIGLRQPGDTVKITLIRDGKKRTVTAKLDKRTAQNSGSSTEGGGNLYAGLQGAHFGSISDDNPLAGEVKGVEVSDVERGSPAARAGLRPGDVITSVNRKPVKSLEDFRKLASADQKQLLLHIRRGRGALFLLIR